MMGFLSASASYGIVLLCFVIAGAIAIFLGIKLRKRKDAKDLEAADNKQENAGADGKETVKEKEAPKNEKE